MLSSSDLQMNLQMNGAVTDGVLSEERYILQQLLESTNSELKAAHRVNQELRKRERELTDRWVEEREKGSGCRGLAERWVGAGGAG
jgi:hypothetical protein